MSRFGCLIGIVKFSLKVLRIESIIGRTRLYRLRGGSNCGFIWCNDEYKRGKAKVAWEIIFLPTHSPREGFNMQSRVANLVANDGWVWPRDWLRKAPNLDTIQIPNLVANTNDTNYWCDLNGNWSKFSVKCAWEEIRTRGNEVPYLCTQDKLRQWDIGYNTDILISGLGLCSSLGKYGDGFFVFPRYCFTSSTYG
nr:reverse transcriptase domain, reverse transcriptase zinc-binding domain protein [Tanacetum cinerariifolium]